MKATTQYIRKPRARADWIALRRNYIGGSDISAVIGLSPWKTPVALWREKRGETIPEAEQNEAMRLGTYLEEYAATRYAEETARIVRNYGFMIARGHCAANIDRLVSHSCNDLTLPSYHEEIRTDTLLECKTSGTYWTDEPPPFYLAQVQFYMELADIDHAAIAAVFFSPRRCFRIYPVERDREVGARLVERAEAFWHYIEADTPPPPQDLADARALFPGSISAAIEATDAQAASVARLAQIAETEKALEAEADKIKGELCAALGENDTLIRNGERLATWKQAKIAEKTDWKAVAAEMTDALDPEAADKIVKAHTFTVQGERRFVLCQSAK